MAIVFLSSSLSSIGQGIEVSEDRFSKLVDTAADREASEEIKLLAPLPVTRILLYSSGVAQILHEGKIEGSVLMELPFSGHDVDDALKSLILADPQGSRQTIIYQPAPDRETAAAKEHESPLTLSQMLQKYRGESIQFKLNERPMAGRIIGVENRPQKMEVVETLLVMQDTGIHAVPVNQISELNFDSETLGKEFKLAFAGLIKSRDATRRRVGLKFEGNGVRTVKFSYVLDAPIWRVTYRLAVDKEMSQLQSWVHLDNVFGYDWNNVEVILRSGRPMVFHSNLFAPIIAERKSVGTSVFDIPQDTILVMQYFGFDPPIRFGDTPRRSEEKWSGGSFGSGGMGGMGGMGGGRESQSGSDSSGEMIPLLQNVITSTDSASQSTRGSTIDLNRLVLESRSVDSRLGLLEYKLKQSVSLESGTSAVIPLWEGSFPSQQYGSIDLASVITDQQFRSAQSIVEIENTSDLPFLMAPVAIFENGSFVGDAGLSATPPKEKVSVIFATDIGVTADVKITNKETVAKRLQYVGLDNWQVLRENRVSIAINVTNQHQKEKTIELQGELPAGGLIDPQPYQQAKMVSSFRFVVPANASREQKYDIAYPDDSRFKTKDLLSNPTLIIEAAGVVNEADAERLAKLVELTQERTQLNQRANEQSQQLGDLLRDQNRWADLVKKLEVSPEAQSKYVQMVTNSEDTMVKLKQAQSQISGRLVELENEWKQLLETNSPRQQK